MKRRYLSVVLALGVAMSLFVGAIATGSAENTNLPDGDDATGAYFPWVPYGAMLGDDGPFYGTVTVQNTNPDAVDLFFFPGDPTGWAHPYTVTNVQPWASTTASASQIGLEEPGGAVRVHAAPAGVVEWDEEFYGTGPGDGEFVFLIDIDGDNDDDFEAGDAVPGDFLLEALQEIAGSVKNVSPQPTVGTANTNANHITVDGYSGMTTNQVASGEHILPIVQTNAGWDTEIKLANFSGDGNVNYNITFYASGDGTGDPSAQAQGTIQAGEAKIIDILDVVGIGPEWVGSAYISANDSIGAVAERYKNVDSMLVTNASRPAVDGDGVEMDSQTFASLVFQDYNFWNTGISVANLDENANNDVTINFYTPGGSLVGQEAFRIPPRGQKFLFVPGNQNLGLGGQIGAAVVNGTTNLHAAVDQVKYLGDDEEVGNAMSYVTTALSELATSDDNQLTGNNSLSVPLVQKGNPNTGTGDTSGIQYFNANGASSVVFTVDFYSTTGQNVAPFLQPFDLSAHQGATVYTHNYGTLSTGFTGSVVSTVTAGGGHLAAVSNNVNYEVQGDGSVAYPAVPIYVELGD